MNTTFKNKNDEINKASEIKKTKELNIAGEILVILLGTYASIFAGVQNLLVSPENVEINAVLFSFGFLMQFIGLSSIVDKVNKKFKNI